MSWEALFQALLQTGLLRVYAQGVKDVIVGGSHIVVKGERKSFLITIEEL